MYKIFSSFSWFEEAYAKYHLNDIAILIEVYFIQAYICELPYAHVLNHSNENNHEQLMPQFQKVSLRYIRINKISLLLAILRVILHIDRDG